MGVPLDTEDRIRRAKTALAGFVELAALVPAQETIAVHTLVDCMSVLTDELMAAIPSHWDRRGVNDDG